MVASPRRLASLLLACLLGLLVGCGCARIQAHSRDEGPPLSFGSALDRPTETIGRIDATRRQRFALFYLLPLGRVDPYEVARAELADLPRADGLVRLKITTRLAPADLALALPSLGLLGSWTVRVEGDAVAYREPARDDPNANAADEAAGGATGSQSP